MGLIYLHGIAATCIIGVEAWERQTPQSLHIDLDIECDFDAAAAEDRLQNTADYQQLAACAVRVAEHGQFQLVETLAVRLCEALHAEFNITWCRVRVHKLRPLPGVEQVGVVTERGQRCAPPDAGGKGKKKTK